MNKEGEPTMGDLLNDPAFVAEEAARYKAYRKQQQADRDDDFLAAMADPLLREYQVHPAAFPEGSPEREARIAKLARMEQQARRRVARRNLQPKLRVIDGGVRF